jgi:N-acylneuraminate cytidylyltransferase
MAPIKCVKKWKYNYGPKAFRFEVNQKAAVDIDTKYDYYAALAWSKLK